ncbi:hypothetical protein GJ496_010981 [Pomphorhynchus laevis]|nr:hypothetical protein GJ496_010981 [Pomphorhynchus laevis]
MEAEDSHEFRRHSISESIYSQIPDISWNIAGNHAFDFAWTPFKLLSNVRQLIPYFPKSFRIAKRQAEITMKNISPGKEKHRLLPSSPFRSFCGVPIGSLGSGSIDRSIFGDFLRMRLFPGQRHSDYLDGCMFIATIRQNDKLLCQYSLCKEPSLTSRHLSLQTFSYIPSEYTHYYALYPRSWTVYKIPNIATLMVRQLSPVIPHNYDDSSIPACSFEWSIVNCSSDKDDLEISITFCWKSDFDDIPTNQDFINNKTGCKGVTSCGKIKGCSISFGIMSESQEFPNSISCLRNVSLEILAEARLFWKDLQNNGCLSDTNSVYSVNGKHFAVCNKNILHHGERKTAKFILAWHAPHIKFHNSDKLFTRYYMKIFDDKGNVDVTDILMYSFKKVSTWEKQIDEWQHPFLISSDLSKSTKCFLLNELYYLTSGGSLWLKSPDEDDGPMREWGKFMLLEGW